MWLFGLSSEDGCPGSSALSGDGSSSGIKSKQARYRCNASDGSVVKSICGSYQRPAKQQMRGPQLVWIKDGESGRMRSLN